VRIETGFEIDSRHFDRWSTPFCETSRDVCSPLLAERFAFHAGRFGESLELGIAAQKMVSWDRRTLLQDAGGSSVEIGSP
jgi:hypothetical protein